MARLSRDEKIEISASIMCIDWLNVEKQLNELEKNQLDYLHFDVIDGRFAPDFTMGSSIINPIRKHSQLRGDYHLMVEEPSKTFPSYMIKDGDVVTIHQECCRNLHRDIISLRRLGARVGVALNPGTPLEALDYIIEDVDFVLLMTVNPGFMGQQLIPQMIRKIEKLRNLIEDMRLDTKISVDGNVNLENIPIMVEAGASVLVAGSSGLFRNDMTIDIAVEKIRAAIDKGLRSR